MAPIRSVHAPGTAHPVGHYSQAVVHGSLVFVSGQLPIRLETGQVDAGSIEEQTELVLRNIDRILSAAGSGLARAVQMTVYISSIDDWPAVNAVYARLMGEHRPARAIVPVNPLHHGVRIEIQTIATLERVRGRRPKRARLTAAAREPRRAARRKRA